MLGKLKKFDISDLLGISIFLLIFNRKWNSYSVIFTIVFIIYYVIKNKVVFNNNSCSKNIFFMYYLLMVISLSWTHDFIIGVKYLETNLTLLIYPFILLYFDLKIEIKKVFNYLIIGSLSGFFFCLIYAYIKVYTIGDPWTPFRYFNFTNPIGIHPGYLSMYLLISFIFIIEEFYKTASTKWKFIYGLLCFICSLCILYIGTKSAFFLLLFISIFYIFRKVKKTTQIIKLVFFLGMLICVFSYIFYNISYGFRTRIFFLINGKYHNLGERMIIYNGMIDIIKNNPLIHIMGLGVGSSQRFLMAYYAENNFDFLFEKKLGTHNIFFRAYLEQGFLGVFFLVNLFQGLKRKYFNQDVFYFLFSFVFFSFGLIEHFLDLQHGVVFFSLINILFYKKNNEL